MTEQKEADQADQAAHAFDDARTGAAAKGGATPRRCARSSAWTHARGEVEVKKPVKRPPGGACACGRCSGASACCRGQGAGGADRPYPQAGRRCGHDAPRTMPARPSAGDAPLRAAAPCCDADRGREGSPRRAPWSTPTATPRWRASAPPRTPPAAPSRMRRARRPTTSTRSAWPRKRRARRPRKRSSARPTRWCRSASTRRPPPRRRRRSPARPRRSTPARRAGDRRRAGAPIRRPPGAPGAGQSTESALRRPPMRPAIVNKRLPQPPGARREVPKRRSDKVDVGRAVEGENDFRSRSAAQMRRRLERDRRREHARRAAAEGLSRGHDPRDHHGPGARPAHVRARRRRHQDADAHGRDGDHQPGDRSRHRRAGRDGNGPPAQARRRGRRRDRPRRSRRCARGAAAAAAGGHHHGPCRPRQDLAARCAARHRRGGARGGRHHPAYRRLPGDPAVEPEDHLPRHAGPRGLHRHARPRRQGDGHRGPGGGGR